MGTRIAHLGLWGLAMAPVAAGCIALPAGSFASGAAALNSLGRLAGIGGLSALLVAAVVSFRIPGFDRFFGGLTTLWRTHHQLGAASFLLLLVHPLLLSFSAVPVSLDTAVAVLFPPPGSIAVWLGWGALLAMMVFLAPSFAFFGQPDYQRWKKLHALSGVAAVLALIHTLMLARTLPVPWGAWLWAVYALAALASLGYGLVLTRRAGQFRYRVAAVAQPANNVVELKLLPEGKPLHYQAGQFVYLRPCDRKLAAGYNEEHPYTLSSSPDEEGLRIAIKDLGDASRAIQTIEPGSPVTLTGPYGAFFAEPGSAAAELPELWIAGGIGITPFLGRARWLAGRGEPVDVNLIYCVQDEARALFADELVELAQRIPGFVLTLHYYYQSGPLDVDFVRDHCPDSTGREVYVCGPEPMLVRVREVMRDAGLPGHRFHSEEFNLL